jgi:hypothetical protein
VCYVITRVVKGTTEKAMTMHPTPTVECVLLEKC